MNDALKSVSITFMAPNVAASSQDAPMALELKTNRVEAENARTPDQNAPARVRELEGVESRRSANR